MSIADQPSATRPPLPDAALEQAVNWCRAARKILKKPALGPGRRGEMAAATKKASELLAKLQTKRAQEYQLFRAEFLQIVEQADSSGRSLDKEMVVNLSARLSQLAKDLTKVLARIKDVDGATAKFDKKLREARIQLAAARGWRDATSPTSPVFAHLSEADSYCDLAESYRNLAASSLEVERLNGAVNSLASFQEQLDRAREAAQAAEECAARSAKEQKRFAAAEQAAGEAAKELEALPGAEEHAQRIRERLTQARSQIRKVDDVWTGHREALDSLKGIDAILEEGRAAHQTLLSTRVPDEVQQQLHEVLELLQSLGDAAPAYEVETLREQAIDAADGGRRAPDSATRELLELAATVRERIAALTHERAAAIAATDDLGRKLTRCRALDLGGSALQDAIRTHERAANSLLPQRRWSEAKRQSAAAGATLDPWLDAQEELVDEWGRRRTELRDMLGRARRAMEIPVHAEEARRLFDAVSATLAEFQKPDFQAALEAFAAARVGDQPLSLSEADQALSASLGTLGDAVDDEEYWREFRAARDVVDRAANDAKGALAAVIYGVKGLAADQADRLIQYWWDRADQRVAEWRQTSSQLPNKADELSHARTLVCTQLAALASDARRVLRRTTIEQLTASLPQPANQREPSRLAAEKKVERWLAELRGLGVDAAAEATQWMNLTANPQHDIQDFLDALHLKVKTARREQQKRRLKFAGELQSSVFDRLPELPVGAEYRRELERQAMDLAWMVDSDDPDLIETARNELAKLQATLDELARDAERHEDNKRRMEAASARVGALMESLPETYRRLWNELLELRVEASRLTPREIAAKVAEFEQHTSEAEDKAKARLLAVADYKELKVDAVERLKTLKAFTAAYPGDRGDAYLVYVESRIKDASEFKAKEDGVEQAIAALESLLQELKSISDAPDKLHRLLQLDSQQVQAQRLVRDMAMQFEQRKAIFTGVTLPRIKAIVESTPDGDGEMVDGLAKAASAAAKAVSPYLKVLKTLPHEKKGAQPAPQMEQMKADFARAYGLLEEAERAALRLLDHGASTNVSLPAADGLLRLEDKWRRRTAAFNSAVRDVAAGIRTAASSEPEDSVKSKAEAAAKLVEELAGRFEATAFSASIRILAAELPETTTEQAAARRTRLAEREVALRTMRQFRDELLTNPLLRQLADRMQNPFSADVVLNAVAGVRVTLKELELQLLNAV